MRAIKKILLVILAIVIAVQVAFIYRCSRLGKIAETIALTDSTRVTTADARYDEYVGIIHAHSFLGGHSTGTFVELISGANDAGVDLVLMTEHCEDEYDTSAITLNGKYGRTLFIGGNEIDTAGGDRFLMVPGSSEAAELHKVQTEAVIDKLHSEKRLALVTYPERYNSWNAQFDGVEVFSLHTAAKSVDKLTGLLDAVWSGSRYPQLTFAQYFRRPDANLAKYDEATQNRRVTIFAGADAHSNIGLHLFGTDSGGKLVSIKIDPYRKVFSMVRVHLLLPKGTLLTRESAVEAVRSGHFYTGIDAIGNTEGFRFSAGEAIFGDELQSSEVRQLNVWVPIQARVVILKNGLKFDERTAIGEIGVKPYGPGVYRVEVYRDDLGEAFSLMPWILSNPIYLR